MPLFNQQSTGNVNTANMMNAAGSYLQARTALPFDFFLRDTRLPATTTDVPDVGNEDFTLFEGAGNSAFSSPAVPSAFDFGGSASSSTSNLETVSPQDLLVNDPFNMSAPNSAALTTLTSPSINESPDLDSFDVSPNFADLDGPHIDSWYSLFPTDSTVPAPQQQQQSLHQQPQQRHSVDQSPALQSEDLDLEFSERPSPGSRKASGASAKHSSVAGVNSRKRDKPLPPIIIDDPSDTVAMKRARNTLAARKSRERKAQRFEELEERIAKLEQERDHWRAMALARN